MIDGVMSLNKVFAIFIKTLILNLILEIMKNFHDFTYLRINDSKVSNLQNFKRITIDFEFI
jgi:hypothetical protein